MVVVVCLCDFDLVVVFEVVVVVYIGEFVGEVGEFELFLV